MIFHRSANYNLFYSYRQRDGGESEGGVAQLDLKKEQTKEIAVIGAGSWGTAIARLLARKGERVTLWARDRGLVRALVTQGENEKYLPGTPLPPENLRVSSQLSEACQADVFFIAVPSFAVRPLARQLKQALDAERNPKERHPSFISLTKGIEYDTFTTMSQLLRQELGTDDVFALSGPSFATEVACDYPTSVVLAGQNLTRANELQKTLMTERFRVYTSNDLMGVEIGGAFKNVIAIAAGISDGLGFGDNAKGALLARGLAELVRLGKRWAARKETFFGLAGLGDLVATCTSPRSRNRGVGEQIGRGATLDQILSGMAMVAEGIYTVRAVEGLARSEGLDLPISHAVYQVLYDGASPLEQLTELMTRQPKREEL